MTVDLTHPERGPSAMTGSELQAIRHKLKLSTVQLGRAAGYVGSDATASNTIRKYESGMRPVPPLLERLVKMFDRYGVPPGWIAGAPAPQKPGRKSLSDLIERVKGAGSVLQLVDALRALEDHKQGAAAEAEIPQFLDYSEWPEVDWGSYADEPISADATHIAFREIDGKYTQTTWKKFLIEMDMED